MEDLPNPRLLSSGSFLGVDVETRDPRLLANGPGGFRNDGHLAGVSFALDRDHKWYIPLGHELGGNVDNPEGYKSYLRDLLRTEAVKVGANLIYDLEWLEVSGLHTRGEFIDIQLAEPLLDEWARSYSLEALSQKYLGHGKDEKGLLEAAASFGFNPKSEMWRLHSKHVGPYAEADALQALLIWEKQQPKLGEENLLHTFQTECELVPVLLANRRKGIRVDLEYASRLREEFAKKTTELEHAFYRECQMEVNVNSADQLAKVYDKKGICFPRTPSGRPSFAADWLEQQADPLSKQIVEIRQYQKAVSTFIDGMIFSKVAADGRVRPVFRQARGETSGTRDGRFSCTEPNLQQVPAHNPVFGPPIRKAFLPEEGHQWAAIDYSAQEPRIQAHFAYDAFLAGKKMRGAAELVEAYRANPNMSTHDYVSEMAGIPRKSAKVLNLSLSYGGGIPTITNQLKISREEAQQLLRKYYEGAPYVQDLQTLALEAIELRGFLTILGGRRVRFNRWEPKADSFGTAAPLPYEEAKERWGASNIKRAFLHKASNKLIQPSAAYQTKRALIETYKAGHIFEVTIHDENGYSVESHDQAVQIGKIMEECVPLYVPSVVDIEIGTSWGDSML